MAKEKESDNTKDVLAVSLTNFLDSGGIIATSVGLALTAWPLYLGFSHDTFLVSIIGCLTGNAFGAAVGALIGGILADKYGRTFIYRYNLLLYALGALIITISSSFELLLVGVILMGLTTGAGVPASWSYISEVSNANGRAYNIGLSQLAWSIGPAAIYFIATGLIVALPTAGGTAAAPTLLPAGTYGPFDGLLAIRIVFLALFVIAMIAWNMQRKLKESDDWAEKKAATKLTFGQMMGKALSNSVNIKTIAFLVAFYLSWNLVAGAMGQFMPFMYTAAGGFTDVQANLLSGAVWTLCSLGSYFIFARLGDRVSHKLLVVIGSVMALASWVVMTYFGTTIIAGTSAAVVAWVLPLFVVLWGVSSCLPQAFYALWSTELFPAQYRGGVSGIMFFLVRGTIGIWSLVMGGVLSVGTPEGFTTAGVVMCVFLVVSLIVGIVGTPNTRGRELDDIIRERYGEDMGV